MLVPALLALAAAPSPPPATPQEAWRRPPEEVADLALAPPPPEARISPDARWILVVEEGGPPPLAELARPWLPLAGVRVDPAYDARRRTDLATGLVLRDLRGTTETRLPLPEDARVVDVGWSHGSRWLAWSRRGDAGTELWAARVDAPERPVLVTDRLSSVFGRGWTWMPDGERLLVQLVPEGRGAPPARPEVPPGPRVQETGGERTPLRTYQDLLDDEHDAALLEHHATSQLALWAPNEPLRPLGPPALVVSADPSPDGRRVLVEELRRPFSTLMPWWRFPTRLVVRDLEGRTEHVLADLPLAEGVPIGGVRTGPRMARWKAGEDATLVWAEALDGGDPEREVPHRDRWLALAAPFDAAPRELARTEERATGLLWMEDPSRVLVSEYDRDRRWTRTTLVDLDDPAAARVVEDRSVRDRYGDPGDPVLRPDARGSRVVRQDGPWIYRTGGGAAEGGARPFLDRQDLRTLETERLWRASPGSYERVLALVQSGTARQPSFVTRYESPDEPPNLRLRDLEEPGVVVALTSWPDPQPALRSVRKELVTYQRADGVPLSATLYLPPDREPGERLPLLLWAYPREYNDPATAGQVSGSPYRFTRFSGPSHLFLVTQGYAVLDDAAMPVIGDPETMNDTYVEQVVAAAEAAIDHVVATGVADPERVAVAGHSYGAFLVANLLAHSDLFRAGVARSGAYNRTLTPFGFQAERRTLWDARPTYVAISPFLNAEGIDEPLLLVHGDEDPNSGTYPEQSERLFAALKGLGGTARLVQLPHEGHGYRSREAVLHVLAETIEWLDRHVGRGPASGAGARGADLPAGAADRPAGAASSGR